MKLHPRLSRATVELVTRFETFQPLAQRAADGGWTVGYGHTRSAREGAQVSRTDAEALLLYDLSTAAEGVGACLFAPVTQRQFEALTAFAFNIGPENFRRSTALARVNGGAELEAADEIERWRHAELGAGAQVVDALVRRRAAEKAHFLGLPEGFSKSPSAVLRPLAVEGAHEPEPPPIEPAPAPSATLSAANTVQARLRELVPEPSPAPLLHPVEDGPEAPPVEAEPDALPLAAEAALAEERLPAPDLPPPELIPLETVPSGTNSPEPVPYAPPPPPVDVEPAPPPANDAASSPAPRQGEPLPAPVSPPAPKVDAPSGEPAVRRSLSIRALYAALTALGACLLVAATVLILGGKAGFGELGLGVVGVLLMTPGVYGLLGPPRPAS